MQRQRQRGALYYKNEGPFESGHTGPEIDQVDFEGAHFLILFFIFLLKRFEHNQIVEKVTKRKKKKKI